MHLFGKLKKKKELEVICVCPYITCLLYFSHNTSTFPPSYCKNPCKILKQSNFAVQTFIMRKKTS